MANILVYAEINDGAVERFFGTIDSFANAGPVEVRHRAR